MPDSAVIDITPENCGWFGSGCEGGYISAAPSTRLPATQPNLLRESVFMCEMTALSVVDYANGVGGRAPIIERR